MFCIAAMVLSGCGEGAISRRIATLNPFDGVSLPDLPRTGAASLALSDFLPQIRFDDDSPPQVDGPGGGYAGPLRPLDGPVALPVAAVPDFDLLLHVAGDTTPFLWRALGATALVGDDLLWNIDIVNFQDRGRRLTAVRPPLASGLMTTTARGRVRGLSLDFPALTRAGGTAPAPGSREYESLRQSLSYLAGPVSSTPLDPESRLGPPAALAAVLAQSTARRERDTVAGRLAGRTEHEGRPAYLIVYDGGVDLVAKEGRVRYGVAGHLVRDAETGLPLASRLRIERSGRIGDREVADRLFIRIAARVRAGGRR